MADFYDWYNENVKLIVDNRYNLKGALVWTPFGFKLQSLVYAKLRELLDNTGHEEVRFPTLIPKEQLEKEEEHVKGFKSEVYWVTKGGLTELEEPLALRPTSETVIYPMFALWIRSHADLPLKIYQIVNTFRYETKHTRPLIRDREIAFFKEAHCAHADAKDADAEMELIQKLYSEFFDALGAPYIITERPEWDRFPGAKKTVSFDQVMPNGRTLQIATSHNLGTHFSKMFNVVYEKEDGTREQAWITCHGISGRAIAGLISAHGDEKGLVLPPKFAPTQVVVVPIIFKEKEKEVVDQARKVFEQVKSMGWRAAIDESDDTPGSKFYKWENRGVPVRIEIGPREVTDRKAVLVRRDNGDKKLVSLDELGKELDAMAAKMHERMKARAWEKQAKLVKKASIKEELDKKGVVFEVEVCSPACAKKLEKESLEYRGNILDKSAEGKCIQCGKKAKYVGILSSAY